MLIINYKGDTPQQRYYNLGVKGNSNANKIVFVVEAQQNDINLMGLICNLKVQSKEHEYLDLIELEGEYDSSSATLSFEWSMPLKSTQYRNIELQLEFTDGEDVVWQTLIAELELNETIKAGEDDTLSDKDLSLVKVLQSKVNAMEESIDDINAEVDDINNNNMWKNVSVEKSGTQTNIVFPRGIIPLRFSISNDDIDYYFDYLASRLIDKNGNELDTDVGLVVSEDNTHVVLVLENVDFNHEDFLNNGGEVIYIHADYMDDWHAFEMNTYNMLHGSQKYIEVSYSELVSLRDGNKLKAGSLYRIIDYHTLVDYLTFNMISEAQNAFDVIVLALSSNELSENAMACLRSGDEYFANSNLKAWKLKYRLDNNNQDDLKMPIFPHGDFIYCADLGYSFVFVATRTINDKVYYLYQNPNFDADLGQTAPPYLGTTKAQLEQGDMVDLIDMDATMVLTSNYAEVDSITKPTGFIYEMTDEFNNTLPYDFKNVLFAMAKVSIGSNGSNRFVNAYDTRGAYANNSSNILNRLDMLYNQLRTSRQRQFVVSYAYLPYIRCGTLANLALHNDLYNYLSNNIGVGDSDFCGLYQFGATGKDYCVVPAEPKRYYFYTFTNGNYNSINLGYTSIQDASLGGSVENNIIESYCVFVNANGIRNNIIKTKYNDPSIGFINVFGSSNLNGNKITDMKSCIISGYNVSENEIEDVERTIKLGGEMVNNKLTNVIYNVLGYYFNNNVNKKSMARNALLSCNYCDLASVFDENTITQEASHCEFKSSFVENTISVKMRYCDFGYNISALNFVASSGSGYVQYYRFDNNLYYNQTKSITNLYNVNLTYGNNTTTYVNN